jgi:hypothetical protein
VPQLRADKVGSALVAPSPYLFWIYSFYWTYVILLDLRSIWLGSAHSTGVRGDFGLLFAELAEERDVVAQHGVVGAGMLDGCIELAFDAGDGLEEELA